MLSVVSSKPAWTTVGLFKCKRVRCIHDAVLTRKYTERRGDDSEHEVNTRRRTQDSGTQDSKIKADQGYGLGCHSYHQMERW